MRQVWNGTKMYTKGGLVKKDLMINKRGRVVSKKAASQAKKKFRSGGLGKWCKAVNQARKELGIEGFMVIKKGTPYYNRAKELYDDM